MHDDMKLSGQELDSPGPCSFHHPSRGQALIWDEHGEFNQRDRDIKVCVGGVCNDLICDGKYNEADKIMREIRGAIGPKDADLMLLLADCDLMLREDPYFCYSADLERIRVLLVQLSVKELTQWGLELRKHKRSISAIIVFHVACNERLPLEDHRSSNYPKWIGIGPTYLLTQTYSSAQTLVKADRRSYPFVRTSAMAFMERMKNMAIKINTINYEFQITTEAVFDNFVVSLFLLMGRYEQARDIAHARIFEFGSQMEIHYYLDLGRVYGDLLCNRGQSFLYLGKADLARKDFRKAYESYERATNVPLAERQQLMASADGKSVIADSICSQESQES